MYPVTHLIGGDVIKDAIVAKVKGNRHGNFTTAYATGREIVRMMREKCDIRVQDEMFLARLIEKKIKMRDLVIWTRACYYMRYTIDRALTKVRLFEYNNLTQHRQACKTIARYCPVPNYVNDMHAMTHYKLSQHMKPYPEELDGSNVDKDEEER